MLLIAWVSFDLATPLPGAFEFDAGDSEVEESIHVRRPSPERATAARRVLPRRPLETERPARRPILIVLVARVSADEWLPQMRLAHLPAGSPPPSSEDH